MKHTLHMFLLSIERKPKLNLLYKHEYLLDKEAKQMSEWSDDWFKNRLLFMQSVMSTLFEKNFHFFNKNT